MLVGCTQFLSGLLWFRGSRDYGMPIGRVLYYFTLLFAVMLALIVGWSRQSASLAMLALVLLLPALVVWYFVLTVREGRMVPLVKKSVLPSL